MRPYGVFVSEVDYVKQKYCFEFVYIYDKLIYDKLVYTTCLLDIKRSKKADKYVGFVSLS